MSADCGPTLRCRSNRGAVPPRRQVPANALMRADSRDSLRDTVLACTTPLLAARCISGCAWRSASCAAALSPPAIVVSTFLMKVRMRDLRAWLRRVRVLFWRMRLRAEAVLAMGQTSLERKLG